MPAKVGQGVSNYMKQTTQEEILEQSLREQIATDKMTKWEANIQEQMDRDSGKGEVYSCHKCNKSYKRGGGNMACLVMHYDSCCHYGDEEYSDANNEAYWDARLKDEEQKESK